MELRARNFEKDVSDLGDESLQALVLFKMQGAKHCEYETSWGLNESHPINIYTYTLQIFLYLVDCFTLELQNDSYWSSR